MPRSVVAVLLWCAAAAAGEIQVTEVFPINFPQAVMGVCFHEGMLYAVTNENTLLKYDPLTGKLLDVIDPLIADGASHHTHGITSGAKGMFWVAETEAAQRLYQFRFSDYSVVSTIVVPSLGPPYGLAFNADTLWLGYHSRRTARPIYSLRPSTGEIVDSFQFGAIDVHGLAWVRGYLWALDNSANVIYQVDCAGEVQNTFTLPPTFWGSLAYDGVRFWGSNNETFVQFDLPLPPPLGDFNADGSVDQQDVAAFESCFGGPMSSECSRGDFDSDCDVDCLDWERFLLAWGGQGELPSLPACGPTIPTVSQWGMLVLAVLLIGAAGVAINRSQRQQREHPDSFDKGTCLTGSRRHS